MTKKAEKVRFATEDGTKIHNFDVDIVQLLQEDLELEYASLGRNINPLLTYVKFILTDDKPNGNKVRIPKEEFSNLIKTGIYMPLKMAVKEIKPGHEDASPLGVITYLVEKDDRVVGIAALWNRERPEDVELIKSRYADGKPLTLSWEIGYKDSTLEDGVETLLDCVLRATTIVGLPAYGKRTPITEVEAKKEEEASKEETKLDELEKAKATIEELKASNTELLAKIQALESMKVTDEMTSELETLRKFKADKDAEAEKEALLGEIKESFEKAGVTKDGEFFTENAEKLLKMKESETLEFYIESLSEVKPEEAEPEKEEESSKKKSGVPRLKPEPISGTPTVKDIATALKERK